MKKLSLLIIVAALAALSSGCVYRSYKEGETTYTSLAVATKQGVAPFTLEAGKKDDPSYRKLESKGLTNDPSASVVEAAVTAAIKAGK